MRKSKAQEQKKIARAKLALVRQTPRKMRRTANLVRGLKVGDAIAQLSFMPYAAALPIRKLISSALANAANNLSMDDPEELYVSELLVDDKSILRRWRAASKGRGVPVLKRCSRLSVAISDMKPAEYAKHVWDISPRNRKNHKKKEANGTKSTAKSK
jgi:large subunit ribosomal protein L22